jgi:hypothetical protein
VLRGKMITRIAPPELRACQYLVRSSLTVLLAALGKPSRSNGFLGLEVEVMSGREIALL